MTFAAFWAIYHPLRRPHPNPRKPAESEWEKSLKRGNSEADIVLGTEGFAAYCVKESVDGKYVPHGRKFLHNDEWAEFVPTPEERAAAAQAQADLLPRLAERVRRGDGQNFIAPADVQAMLDADLVTADEARAWGFVADNVVKMRAG